jgi:hypothetical protein
LILQLKPYSDIVSTLQFSAEKPMHFCKHFEVVFAYMPQWMESVYYLVLYAVAISGSVRNGNDPLA